MNTTYPLTLFYDAACPVCRLEMDNLRARNALNRLVFKDISAPGFDAERYGATLQEMGALLHGQRADGTLVIGAETIRLAYRAVGLGYLAAPTDLPGLRPLFDAAYAVFARNRYGISALFGPVIERVAAARAAKRMQACKDGQCEVNSSNTNTNTERRTS